MDAAEHQYYTVQWTRTTGKGFVHSWNDGRFYCRDDAEDYAERYMHRLRRFPPVERTYEIVAWAPRHDAPKAYWI